MLIDLLFNVHEIIDKYRRRTLSEGGGIAKGTCWHMASNVSDLVIISQFSHRANMQEKSVR